MEKEKTEDWANNLTNPIVVKIINTTDEEQSFKLFGFAKYAHLKGYGTPEGVIIQNLQSEDGYASLLYSTAGKTRRKIEVWRFTGDECNITKCYSVHHENISGIKVTSPLNLANHKDDIVELENEAGDKSLTIKYSFTLDGDSHITGKIEANSEVVISMFLKKD